MGTEPGLFIGPAKFGKVIKKLEKTNHRFRPFYQYLFSCMNEMSYEYDGKIFPVQEIIELVNKKIDFLHYFIFLLEVQIGYYIRSPVQKI